ncbi:hypothetical protein ACGFWE_41015 [Streptomyces sp. NPDC048523]|uniref:hypothetical protein n=1 Tax=Streptomyces sp. NPDC048523 TaxID=3365567 RepID=UPI0037121110
MTVWIVPAATILVPVIVGCLTSLQMFRTLAQAWAATFTNMSHCLDEAAQTPRPEPLPAAPTPQSGARHSARTARSKK